MKINSLLGQLRLLALLEGISYLLFAITMPLKYSFDIAGPNKFVGMAHGALFIAYIMWVMLVRSTHNMNLKQTFWSLLASIVPAGTFIADSKIFKRL